VSKAAATLGLLFALSGFAATIHVSPTGSATAPYDSEATALTSIQAAVNTATSGDTIRIHAATYQENVFISGKALTLQGSGMVATVIDGRQVSSCINISDASDVSIFGCELRNGQAEKGGGIYLDNSSLTMRQSRIVGCRAGRGGGIYSFQSSFTFEDGAIYECDAYLFTTDGGKGGAFYLLYSPAGSPSRIADSAIYANRAVHGALRWWEASATIERCQIFGNRAQTDVIELRESSTGTLNDCLIYGNQSLNQTIVSTYIFSDLTICHSTIADNDSSGAGSVIFQDVWSGLAMHNNAVQANVPDLAEVAPDADLAGNVFSAPPAGFSILPQSANFASGDDGQHYLASSEASPSIFIGAGQTSALCTVVDADRQPYVTGAGPVPATPPHAGYGYPSGASGAIDLVTPAFTMTARGRPYLSYRLEMAEDAIFSNISTLPLGSLPSVDIPIPIPLPATRAQFYRMRGSEPRANDVSVTVSDGGGPLAGITVDLLNATGTEWYGSMTTDGSGSAAIDKLPPGNYTLFAGSQSADYVAYFLGDTTEIGAATTFVLAADSSYSGSFTLVTGNRLSGHVQTAASAALEGASVVVYDALNSDAIVKTATTNASGDYDIGGLADGSYKIGASGEPQHGFRYHSNAADLASATAVPLAGGSTQNLPLLTMPARESIGGRVSLPDAGALCQIVVVLYNAADFSEVEFAFCDAGGNYQLYAEPGTYVLSAGEGSAYVVDFSPEFTQALGTPTLIDFDLQHGGSISGTIIDNSGLGISDIFVDFYTKSGSTFTYIDSDVTDANGNYLSPLLSSGTYYVQAYGAPSYNILWYPGTVAESAAVAVPVAIFQDTPGIDIQLTPVAP
jgi:hypothetical protein